MEKYLKKFSYMFLIIIMLTVNFSLSFNIDKVEAKTLRDLKSELEEMKRKQANNENDKKLTESQISSKKQNIASINKELMDIEQEVKDLTKEIEELNVSIVEKQEEVKRIINYYQVANGESAYLEYLFNAADYTDFIYRLAVAEQLSVYNSKLVDEYNQMIKNNEQKKKDLANKKVSLNQKQDELEKELVSLGSHLNEISDVSVTLEEDIKSLEEMINTYENVFKCKLDENINSCGINQLPPGTKFLRPIVSGFISSDYGARTFLLNGKWVSDFHYGADFAGSGHGANVYSIANGKVAYITRKAGCGGNMVYIHHTVNGENYTSGYFHLATINVDVGDTVTTNSVIGTVGGAPWIETWDSCSGGIHVHLQLARTHISAGEGFYTRFTAKRMDPREVLNYPAEEGWFSNRTTRF